ncbi:MAG: GntR family transcriptional regulator [Chitinophagaceae bacterium]|nr:MAG: GntR family transcriptional regulator [Chitinophagaceae bacterium]
MIYIGKYNKLQVLKDTPQGKYLGDDVGNEVLLPNVFIPEGLETGDEIEVFVYRDSEERPVATTEKPLATVGEFATLEIGSVLDIGTFFNWGLPKQLLVPKALQHKPIVAEDKFHVVHILMDEVTDRIVGTTKISRYLDNSNIEDLSAGDEVDLIAFHETNLGIKVIINQKHEGLIYRDEIFKPINYGDTFKGYIKKIRAENKIDISLEKFGYRKVDPGAEKIMEVLETSDGFLPLHDKSDPELIKKHLGMSKKVFKKAIGAMYKKRLIRLEKDGIHLNKSGK